MEKKYRLPNPDGNAWIDKCNTIIELNENNVQLKPSNPVYIKYSLHHILIRSEYPELTDDPANHLYLSVEDHINLHYYMWKGNSKYCAAFWFCYVWFHKNRGYSITDKEYEQLKADMREYRRAKKAMKQSSK